MFVYHRFPWPYIYILIYIHCLYNPWLHRPSSLIWMYKGWPACKFQPLQFSGNCIDVVSGERNFLICVEEPFWYLMYGTFCFYDALGSQNQVPPVVASITVSGTWVLLPMPNELGWMWRGSRNDKSELILYSYSHDSSWSVVPNFNILIHANFLMRLKHVKTIMNRPWLGMVYTTYLYLLWNWGWFIMLFPTLLAKFSP